MGDINIELNQKLSLIQLSLGKKQACSVRGLVPTFSTPLDCMDSTDGLPFE